MIQEPSHVLEAEQDHELVPEHVVVAQLVQCTTHITILKDMLTINLLKVNTIMVLDHLYLIAIQTIIHLKVFKVIKNSLI